MSRPSPSKAPQPAKKPAHSRASTPESRPSQTSRSSIPNEPRKSSGNRSQSTGQPIRPPLAAQKTEIPDEARRAAPSRAPVVLRREKDAKQSLAKAGGQAKDTRQHELDILRRRTSWDMGGSPSGNDDDNDNDDDIDIDDDGDNHQHLAYSDSGSNGDATLAAADRPVYFRRVRHASGLLSALRRRRAEAQEEVCARTSLVERLRSLPFRTREFGGRDASAEDFCARCGQTLWSETVEMVEDPNRGKVKVTKRRKDCVQELGMSFHRGCFTCFGCETSLESATKPGSYSYSKDENTKSILCTKCYSLTNGKICSLCTKSITQTSYRKGNGKVYCQECSVVSREPCIICARPVPDQFLRVFEWKEPFCPSHQGNELVKCDSCERPESKVPEANLDIDLFDEQRHSCRDCRIGAITNKEGLSQLSVYVLRFFELCGLTFPVKLEYLPASLEVMSHLKRSNNSDDISRGICLSKVSTFYSYSGKSAAGANPFLPPISGAKPPPSNDMAPASTLAHGAKVRTDRKVEAIVILYGFNAIVSSAILAHELTHAWLVFNTKLSPGATPLKVEEGLAQLASYLWLQYLRNQLQKVCPEPQSQTRRAAVGLGDISSIKDTHVQSLLLLFFPAGFTPRYYKFLDFLLRKHHTHPDPNYGGGFLEAKRVYDLFVAADPSAAKFCFSKLCRRVAETASLQSPSSKGV